MKLAKDKAEAVETAESASRDLVDEGIYTVSLRSVEPKNAKKPPHNPYWLWTYEIPDDADQYAGKRFFDNTSLQDSAAWKMKQVFDAFGVPADTDTDELVGEKVRLVITQRPIAEGPRMGEMTNQVAEVLPLTDEDDEDGDTPDNDEPPF